MKQAERACGEAAYKLVLNAGGFLTFSEYDKKAATNMVIFPPLNWCQGWGNHEQLVHNQNILAAHAACQMGLLVRELTGYRTPNHPEE